MCGRSVQLTPRQYALLFGAEAFGRQPKPRYNLAPGQPILSVLESREPKDKRYLLTQRWGISANWSSQLIINARYETAASKPMFADAFRLCRSIVPVDGFYEWQESHPWLLRHRDGEPLALAALWQIEPKAERGSCAILTGPAEGELARLHPRIPIVLPRESWDAWLDRDYQDVTKVARLLQPTPARLLEAYRVSPLVNDPSNDMPALLNRVA